MIGSRTHPRTDGAAIERDRGAALVIMLALIVIASLVVLPILDYGLTVTWTTRVLQEKVTRLEAVKGGLRVALSDPVNLYKTCADSGDTVGVALAGPGLDTPVSTHCYELDSASADDSKRRYAIATTQVGALPPVGTIGTTYPGSGLPPEAAWRSVSSTSSEVGRVWLPNLPAHPLNRRSSGGYSMPSTFPSCTVFFPGTYADPLTLEGPTPAYFTSGIYYFESTVRFTQEAKVVIGGGATPGCTTDQEAAFHAKNAPTAHYISGLGATFVFGKSGRLLIDNAGGSGTDVTFNQRYVNQIDVSSSSSAGVSIMSVNGEIVSSAEQDLVRPSSLSVPLSRGVGAQSLASQEYVPSVLTPQPAPAPAPSPVLEIAFTTGTTVNVVIPGYVSVPQGRVVVAAMSPGAAVNKTVRIVGGVLGATIEIGPFRPERLELGFLNPVVQRTFKIVSRTTAGAPHVVSDAVVQVNENGAYAVNTWEVQ